MTKECVATIFQINLSFPNASHPHLKGTSMLVKVSISLNDLQGILLPDLTGEETWISGKIPMMTGTFLG